MLATLAEVRAQLVAGHDEDLGEVLGMIKEHDLKLEAEDCLSECIHIVSELGGGATAQVRWHRPPLWMRRARARAAHAPACRARSFRIRSGANRR